MEINNEFCKKMKLESTLRPRDQNIGPDPIVFGPVIALC